MSTLAFVTHPSVRIKGTENVYTPTQCMDERCPIKAPHLHCPLCVKTDAYQDPVILKAHYRVKHVDKGIDFAGLKILRCCDQCDIIGIIKGEKRFKGAHWHCYRCRNGFNRRDEAIKHYKTHFRNPQTTFQIQITQDLNSPPEIRSHEDHSSALQEAFGPVHNPIQAIMRTPISQQTVQQTVQLSEANVMKTVTNSFHHGNSIQKVKHERLDKEDDSGVQEDEETIMIIQGTQLETALASHIIDSGELGQLGKASIDPTLSWEIRFRMEEEEKNMYKAKAEDYKMQVDLLKQQVEDLQSQLTQQRQLCFHELLAVLASDDQAQKQAASEQVAKFLEQCHTFLPTDSLSLLRGSLGDALQLQSQHQEREMEQQQQQQHEADKTSGLPGLMADYETGPTGCSDALVLTADAGLQEQQKQQQQQQQGSHVTQCSIAPDLQVICTSTQGQVLMDTASGVSRCERDVDLEPGEHPVSISVQQPVCVTQTGQVEQQAAMFAQILGQQEHQEIEVQGVLPAIAAEPTVQGLEDTQGAGAGLLSTGCLMEVVAASGLTALGRDVAAITSTAGTESHHPAHGTFMMTLEDGQGLIIQQASEEQESQEHSGASCDDEVCIAAKDEPGTKRLKVS